MRRFGLIGFPLSHSFSKKYFSDKFEREGYHDHVYELFPIASIEMLPSLIQSYPDLVGLNVTIPYKQAVIPYLHQKELPGGMNASNCIRVRNGHLTGYNTDVTGFEKSFITKLKPHHTKALVLGNGGATAAVVYVLKKLGLEFDIVSRQKREGSSFTYHDLDKKVIEQHTVIINASPVGTYPAVEECPDIPYEYLSSDHYLFDLIYNPSQTTFLKKGEQRGAATKNGYDMLEIQAEESWKIWNAE